MYSNAHLGSLNEWLLLPGVVQPDHEYSGVVYIIYLSKQSFASVITECFKCTEVEYIQLYSSCDMIASNEKNKPIEIINRLG